GAVRSEMGGLRDEMRKEFGAVRSEMGGLRDEMHKEFGAVRSEMGALRDETRKELGALSKAVTHGDLVTRIWMLLLCGAMLGVMARGFHWI
ncbi:MAG: hypothetical protein KGO22_16745, partial [Gammaproteobacteria bacterium]|nr:hypothetical protein [Gammaproteobacteria bacterium]